jgi:hypothetical protein
VGGRGVVEPPGNGTTGTRGGGGSGRGLGDGRRSGARPGGGLTREGGGQHQGAPEGRRGARSPKGGAAELANVASVPTPEATAAMLVGKHKEVLGEMATGVLKINEARQDSLWQNLHRKVNNAIKDIAQGAVHATRRLDDTPILGHVGNQPLNVESLSAPSNTHARQGVRRRPAVDDGATSSRPGDACLELVQGSLAGIGGDEPDTKELRRGDHKHIRDGGDVHGEILKEKLITLLLGEIGLNSTQINKNSKALKIGDMMERSGGGGRQAIGGAEPPRAAATSA